jgi:hypothetical protein
MSTKLTESQINQLKDIRDNLALTKAAFSRFACRGVPCSECPIAVKSLCENVCGTTVISGLLAMVGNALNADEKPTERITIRGVTYELKEIKDGD